MCECGSTSSISVDPRHGPPVVPWPHPLDLLWYDVPKLLRWVQPRNRRYQVAKGCGCLLALLRIKVMAQPFWHAVKSLRATNRAFSIEMASTRQRFVCEAVREQVDTMRG